MPKRLPKTDVVIVGMGAAGGAAALPLTNAGLKVIGIEAGGWLSPRDFAPDELRNGARNWPQSVQKAATEAPTVRATSDATAVQGGQPMMNAVGGTSMHYWAQSWRLNPWDFKVVSATRERYGRDRLPSDTTVEDWPFGYEELEPYYDKVEYAVGISGRAGNVQGRINRDGNIFEGERSREYPMRPLRSSPFTEMMSAAARRLDLNPFQGPAAITSELYDGRPPCQYHGFCNKGGCHVQAKSSTAFTTIPKAVDSGNLEVVTFARVTNIVTDNDGKVTGVDYVKGSETFFQPADVVLLASYTYENVRMLQLSKSRAFPNGLSNNAGQVGQHYLSHHQGSPVLALFPEDLHNWYGLPAQGVAVDDWADDNFDHADLDFIGGANLWVHTDRKPMAAAKMSTFGLAPNWGSQWKAFIMQNADRSNTSYIQKSTLPYAGNYLDLDPTVKDPMGVPVIRITARYRDNEKRIAAFVADKMEQWYLEAGASRVIKTGPGNAMGASTHAYGGTRMGNNSETNVVNRWGFSHEAPNLGILGASVMGTSGARNPTLTAQALSWRTAEYLANNWRSVVG
ncbi:MAG: GMC family oxidoreductase [Gammaproteobacteria bacterium]|jgi:gluconate 2-dehydrogenase alpha chain|nr:GMC family oxidoreductase [Gammaproteobacteria bacterium]MDP6731396.1 GMC family oxidoreductase [Gammaproteobacteria bacterium]|tara:strand:- start:1117 stop:2820 length:1704 start_codon:yes stop_codon:yes gene_type:complete